MIRAHKTADGYVLMSDDGVIVPLTPNEAHSVYVLVAAELAELRRKETEEADA